MHETLSSLVARAFTGNQRPLEFYLREQSRLPGTRANLELVSNLSSLLTAVVLEQPDQVWMLLNYLVQDEQTVVSNTPDEFVVLCGVVAFGACATVRPEWRIEVFELLGHLACSGAWRVREGVAMAFQRLLPVAPQETIEYLMELATKGNCFNSVPALQLLLSHFASYPGHDRCGADYTTPCVGASTRTTRRCS